jgi:hypothetical protein
MAQPSIQEPTDTSGPLAFLVGGALVTAVLAAVELVCGKIPHFLGGGLALLGGLLIALFVRALSRQEIK